LKLLGLNFEVPKLEVLNLSQTKADDETLYAIPKSCRGLTQLLLKFSDVTEKGVKNVVENCTQLREINLRGVKHVFSRPLLRKIIPPNCPFDSCRRVHC
jgi:F-box/leucine-rich repeat protein 2/20